MVSDISLMMVRTVYQTFTATVMIPIVILSGHVAQRTVRLTQQSEVPGSIPGSFLLALIPLGQLSVTGESMCTKNWLTA